MKKKLKDKLFGIFIVGILALAMIGIPILLFSGNPNELIEGELATEFCTEKCGENDLLTSNNNSDYNFIRCECVVGVSLGDGKYASVARPKVAIHYFDNLNLEEISKQDILDKLK